MASILARLRKVCSLFLFLTFLLVCRLVFLQIIDGADLAREGLSGRVQEASGKEERGLIFDRNNQLLTNRDFTYHIMVFPSPSLKAEAIKEELESVLSDKELAEVVALTQAKQPSRSSFAVTEDVMHYINVEAHQTGIMVVKESIRYSPENLATHVIGYTNADNHGVSGVEALYDDFLSSQRVKYLAALVDASAQVIPGLGYKELNRGVGGEPSNLILTLDLDKQRKVEKLADKYLKKGAVVVMEPTTGEILALVSRPNYDNNHVAEILHQASSPLLNRAVAAFQPGSVFKLVVAAAALEQGIVRPEQMFYDHGYIDINHVRFNGWDVEQSPRGWITFQDALAYSSNPVFIEVGQKLGAKSLLSYAHKLGFGELTKLNFDGEVAGNLPAADQVFPADLANLSIGQGSCETTPLQMAALVATICNDGIKVEPSLVKKIVSSQGTVLKQNNIPKENRVLSKATCKQLKNMMTSVTQYGTGQAANIPDFGSAGKTGSAETGRLDSQGNSINHAWFAGYAPLNHPQYVVVVFVEEGHSGSDVAAPLFQDVTASLLGKS
ncbi:peptidoglycan glycosyltransferase/penicillin-binding protein 2 [Sporomusaceae bacterium BoRhaA]|uniref:peptidoglycan D,D-transpeptidase FtsI family protein n=1 Tax=Pelorhabdus rhamnosifermentans TaxID=2772457 RepID=UPI001C063E1D|nr:penicillin-binding protein 2 [Pelorhabdus rhamnosifermentans]MBU2700925.1 peptidoglycan glycosyltransferase/penicillin-binding protein 2 [Pelorhabdus rhamnosifermentans]